VLVRVGLVSIEKLKEIRPYVIVGAFVVGAIFTPPDVLSQFMLAVPMWLLYELGILLAQLIGKSARVDASAQPPLDDAAMNAELDRAEADSATNRARE
jgi:sec-independent protein translocase protein TatC